MIVCMRERELVHACMCYTVCVCVSVCVRACVHACVNKFLTCGVCMSNTAEYMCMQIHGHLPGRPCDGGCREL